MPAKNMRPFFSKKLFIVAAIAGWLTAVAGGMWKLCAYSFAPGAQAPAPASRPADFAPAPTPGTFTAVLALHPECDCSDATLQELDSIMNQSAGKLSVQLLFVQLPGLPPVEKSSLWQRAQRIPGIQLLRDPLGTRARQLGAQTSGEMSLYGPEGRLRFQGGITLARGHVGENPGASAVLSVLGQPDPAAAPLTTPVFGCALWDQCAAATPSP